MTTEIQSVLEYADYRFVLNNQKQLLKEKTLQHLRYSHNGGNFNIDSTLISITKALVDAGNTVIYLMDTNNNPIEVKEAKIFLDAITEKYMEVMKRYHTEYKELTKNRTVKKLVEWQKVY